MSELYGTGTEFISGLGQGQVDTYGQGHIAECILIIAEAQYQDVNVVDKEINFMSTILRLKRTIGE